MTLDVGTLVAYIDVDDRRGRRAVDTFQRHLQQVARTPVRDVEVGVDTRRADRAITAFTAAVTGVPDVAVRADVDTSTALVRLGNLDAAVRDIPDADVAVEVDAAAAMGVLDALAAQIRSLPDGDIDADVDALAALRGLDRIASQIRGLPDGEVEVTVDVDDGALDGVGRDAEAALGDAGQDAGEAFGARVVDALESIPVAGAVVGVGAAMAAALIDGVRDGLASEVNADRLLATTDLTPAQVAKIGRAAGEAYAENFGDSVAGNMDTARAALGAGLIDADATQRDTQRVIEQLSGVADILGEEIPAVSRAAGQLIRTGFATDAGEAFDLLVRGAKSGLNASEDLLDTVNEYSTQFRKLGLDGPEAFGLLSQAVQAGARDTDIAADALKEFSIRAVDGSKTSAAGYEAIGLSAEAMTAKIAAGGAGAKEGLDQVLDGLRAIEDPVVRDAAAVALFGTQAEDLGAALLAMDGSTAVRELGAVKGAAENAVATLGDNEAGSVESALRNIHLAASGLKGAMAEAFGPQIGEFAQRVRENRTEVVETLLAIVNGTFDVSRAVVEMSAAGVEGFGEMAAGGAPVLDVLASIVDAAADVAYGMGRRGLSTELREAADGIRDAGDQLERVPERTDAIAEGIRRNVIEQGLDPAQARLNEFGDMQIAEARIHDATVRLADDIAGVGYAADGTKLQVSTLTSTLDTNTTAGRALADQLAAAGRGLLDQAAASREAGRSAEDLSADFRANRDALIEQVVHMGYSRDRARELVDRYGEIPSGISTLVEQPGMGTALGQALLLHDRTHGVPDRKQTTYEALGTKAAIEAAERLNRTVNGIPSYKGVTVEVVERYRTVKDKQNRADGGYAVAAADGLDRSSRIAPGGASITWAEPETGWEAYISGRPSQRHRNEALLADVADRFGLAVVDPRTARAAADGALVQAVAGAFPRAKHEDGSGAVGWQFWDPRTMGNGQGGEPYLVRNDAHGEQFVPLDPASLAAAFPAAANEDGSGQSGWQFWNAATQGNGRGQSGLVRNDEGGERFLGLPGMAGGAAMPAGLTAHMQGEVEEILDELREFGPVFRRMGIDGPTAFGLLHQAVRDGADDWSIAAHNLMEFQGNVDTSRALDALREFAGGSEEVTRYLTEQAHAAAGTGESTDALARSIGGSRDALADQLGPMRESIGEAGRLRDRYYEVPDDVSTSIDQPGILEGLDRAGRLREGTDAIPDIASTLYEALGADGAIGVAQRINELVNGIPTKRVVNVEVVERYQAVKDKQNRADGGIDIAAASGLDRHSRIAPGGANITWAEAVTGWEAYISGRPSQRARNERILADVAGRFGLALIDPGQAFVAADGRLTGAAAAPGGRGQVAVTIGQQHFHNPAPARAADDSVEGLRAAAAYLAFR